MVVVDDREVRAERLGGAMITLGVSDLDDFLTRLAAHGIARERPETYINGVRHVVVLDPDGNSLSLAEAPAQSFTPTARAGCTCGSLVRSEIEGVGGDPSEAGDRAPLSRLRPPCILTGNPIPFDVAPGNRWNGPVVDTFHDDELRVDVRLVRALVDRYLPEYSSLLLSPLGSSGSSNALFRLGDEFLVRLPRQPGGTTTIEKEARWSPQIGRLLPVSVPEIVAIGQRGFGYPERWSVVRWIEGNVPTVVDPRSEVAAARGSLALDLAAMVNALHAIVVPPSALVDPSLRSYRGASLAAQDMPTRRAIQACRDISELDLDLDAALRVWDQAMTLPGIERVATPRWYHGDLLAENLLVRDGRLTAVLDFGDLAVGDPTVDLIVAWEVLDTTSRDVFRRAVGADDPSWFRARAWALTLALGTFPYYWVTMPDRCASRLAIARSILADSTST